jgi:hypothetical protein
MDERVKRYRARQRLQQALARAFVALVRLQRDGVTLDKTTATVAAQVAGVFLAAAREAGVAPPAGGPDLSRLDTLFRRIVAERRRKRRRPR